MNNKAVYLLGNLCIDLIISKFSALPDWGQEVTGHTHRMVNSGQTVYTAAALSHLERPVRIAGYLGDDEFGGSIRRYLDTLSIGSEDIEIVPDGETALTIAVIREDGERAFISHFGCQGPLDDKFIEKRIPRIEQSSAIGLLGVFNLPGFSFKRFLPLWVRWKRAGLITLLDTGWDPAGWPKKTIDDITAFLPATTLFLPNLDEAKAITGFSDPERAGRRLLEMGAEWVIVKMGKEGSLGLHGKDLVYQNPFPADVVDAVGAGDVFNAGFLNALMEGAELNRCLLAGTAAATHYIARKEERFPSIDDLQYQIGINS